MPRKKLIYSDEHPYHIMARANNRDWFYLPIEDCWGIFMDGLKQTQKKFNFRLYIFVLMSNHYHMIGSCSKDHPLGEVMAWLQKYVSRTINSRAGRINHIFGGPYKACLIRHPQHFSGIFKYVARNPVKAGIIEKVESYRFSTLCRRDFTISARDEWFAELPEATEELNSWLNIDFSEESYSLIKGELQKTEFGPRDRTTREPIFRL